LAVPLGALAVSAGPGYQPEAGASDTQYWEVTHTFSLDGLSVELSNGDDVEVPEIEMDATRTRTVTMEQIHEASGEGAPTSLRRSFVDLDDAIEGSIVIEGDDVSEVLDAEVEGDLADRSVRLAKSDDDGEWSRAFVDEEGEETEGPAEALKHLVADSHLGGLMLGPEEASEGASWTADPEVLAALVAPGGKTHTGVTASSAGERGMEPALAGLDPLLGMDLWELLGGPAADLDGEIGCKVVSSTTEALMVEFNVEVTSTCDVSEKLTGWIESVELPFPVEVTSGEAILEAEGKGTVTWDLQTNLPVKLELDLELAYQLNREATIEIPGQDEAVLSSNFELVGTLSSAMSAE
jgi:hypothetical protein